MPNWQETHAPDLGIALVELLAYAGDYLSYYQDAVATEAYLGTARQRISVRRHARLVDYAMHEGCNARAWVTIETDKRDSSLGKPQDFYFITSFPRAPDSHALKTDDLVNVPAGSYEVFEPLVEDPTQEIHVYKKHSEIHFYTWGDCQCCLAKGAIAATLKDHWIPESARTSRQCAPKTAPPCPEPPGMVRALNLCAGDVLIFEEVMGPKTGNPADADPKHRQAVRLTKVTQSCDPLYHQQKEDPDYEEYRGYGQPIVEIEWCSEDALTFPLCISAQAPPPECITCLENISVARGNVVLVDNGQRTGEPLGTVPAQSTVERCIGCGPAETVTLLGPFRPALKATPLTFSEPLPPCGCASALIPQDPRRAFPQISLFSIPPAPSCTDPTPSPCQIPCQIQPVFTFADLADPTALASKLQTPTDPSIQFLHALLSQETKRLLCSWAGTGSLPADLREKLVDDLKALLESGPNDRDFVVEIDNDGYAHLRFGDGNLGRMPEAGAAFQASYRVGNGPVGNVGAETITYLVFRQPKDAGDLRPRNPLPATDGTAPETMAAAKLFAPYAFRDVLERAITGEDCAALAQDNDRRLKERPIFLRRCKRVRILSLRLPRLEKTSEQRLRKSLVMHRYLGQTSALHHSRGCKAQRGRCAGRAAGMRRWWPSIPWGRKRLTPSCSRRLKLISNPTGGLVTTSR